MTRASAAPVRAGGSPKAPSRLAAMAFTWLRLPMPKEASTASQPAMGQSAHPRRKVIHGAAVPAAGAVLPVAQAQQVFGVGGHHPEKGRHPHPEDGPRPAADEGCAHPHDAPGADGGPQRGAQALQGADAARVLPGEVGAAPQDGPQRLPQPEGQAGQLEPSGPHRQPQPRRGQQAHPQRPPHHPVDRRQQFHTQPPKPRRYKNRSHTTAVRLLLCVCRARAAHAFLA